MKHKELSRQRRWQLKKIAEGKCQSCGKPRNLYAAYCDDCAENSGQRQRDKRGHSRWEPGSPGPKPFWFTKREVSGAEK